jgi:DNA-binding MarR family transcriptional regulator
MPKTIALDATHVRILQWLRHYPFQRLEDLVVALFPWCSRTTVYRHLKELEDAQFIETLKAPLCAGKSLYHLSPVGLTWYLVNTQANAETLSEQDLRDRSAAEHTTLLRLLPRVPVLLALQTAVNGLVCGAAHALTLQGRRAHLVQWNWRRDASHTFLHHGRSMRWFADGVGAFCLRYTLANGGAQEHWYRFFLLYTPLTYLHLMRARLDRLLRWREAKERWLAYTQMPPILILAASPRQAEWWFEAAERVTHELGVMPPLGAIASATHLSDGEGMSASSFSGASLWQLLWKRLGSQSACHLHDVFSPQNDPGFPDLFPQEILPPPRNGAREKVQVPPIRLRLYRLGQSRKPRQREGQNQRASLDTWRLACVDLTPRKLELLALLQAHPLLDRENLCAHLHLERSSLRHLLAPMSRARLIESYMTSAGERFALAEGGLRLLTAASHCHVRYVVHRPKTTEEPLSDGDTLVPRGLPGLLKKVEHIAGVYGFFDELAGLGCLRWWETGSICARFYQYGGSWYGIRPDAIAECHAEKHTNGRPWRIFLEWDRGTMHERDLRRKMEVYARYLTSREWAREHQIPPTLLSVLPDVGQERLLARAALARLRDCPIRFPLYTTTRSLLMTFGMAAAIWRQILPQVEPTADTPVLLRLFSHHTAGEMKEGE